MRHRVVLFTKPAIPGLVKTRLQTEDGSGAPVLSAALASSLHLAFLTDTSRTLQQVCNGMDAVEFEIAWALDGGHAVEAGFEHLPHFEQHGSDLGERLFHGLQHRSQTEVESSTSETGDRGGALSVVVAVGSDHPELQATVVVEALAVVSSDAADIAIGPADDGGYYLLAVRSDLLSVELFAGVNWSTGSVLEQTLARAHKLGLRVHLLPMNHDCDTPGELEKLAQRLSASPEANGQGASQTRAWLKEHGLMEQAQKHDSGQPPATLSDLAHRLTPSARHETRSESETTALGREFGIALTSLQERPEGNSGTTSCSKLILLRGEMGAGKTAFVRGLAEGLDVSPALVQSPTFTLINEYDDSTGKTALVHCDLYRLDPSELEASGVFDVMSREDAVVVVEWAERLANFWPDAVTLRLSRPGRGNDPDGPERRRIEWLRDGFQETEWG